MNSRVEILYCSNKKRIELSMELVFTQKFYIKFSLLTLGFNSHRSFRQRNDTVHKTGYRKSIKELRNTIRS